MCYRPHSPRPFTSWIIPGSSSDNLAGILPRPNIKWKLCTTAFFHLIDLQNRQLQHFLKHSLKFACTIIILCKKWNAKTYQRVRSSLSYDWCTWGLVTSPDLPSSTVFLVAKEPTCLWCRLLSMTVALPPWCCQRKIEKRRKPVVSKTQDERISTIRNWNIIGNAVFDIYSPR